MRRLPLATLLLVALCALAAASSTSAAISSTPLAPVADDTSMSAYGGYVAWSEKGPDGLWRLVVLDAHGKRALTQIPPRPVPFDVDLGPDAAGHATATYSRCASEPDMASTQPGAHARGCVIRAAVLPGGGEHALAIPTEKGASDSTPSVWGRRVAFQRRAAGADVSQVMLYDFGTRRMKTLPHGAFPHNCPFNDGCPKARFQGEVGELDLGARAAAYSWHVSVPSVIGVGTGWELRAVATGGRRATLLAGNGYVSGACGGRVPLSPSVVAGGVMFLSRWYHCETVEGTITRALFSTGGLLDRTDDVGGPVAWRMAYDAASGAVNVVFGPPRANSATGRSSDPLQLVRLTSRLSFEHTGKVANGPFI